MTPWYECSDTERPRIKAWAKALSDAGSPLMLLPAAAGVARSRGFEERVHYRITKDLVTAASHGAVIRPAGKPKVF